MIPEFEPNNREILQLLAHWEPELLALPDDVISNRRNTQGRNIKQILGHMADSASNNTHRTIHLQYQQSPINFPDYANHGNNDKWIAIQQYETENWPDLVQYWKFLNRHFVHTVRSINPQKLNQIWVSATHNQITLKEMVLDYLPHFKLHLSEISGLINLENK